MESIHPIYVFMAIAVGIAGATYWIRQLTLAARQIFNELQNATAAIHFIDRNILDFTEKDDGNGQLLGLCKDMFRRLADIQMVTAAPVTAPIVMRESRLRDENTDRTPPPPLSESATSWPPVGHTAMRVEN